MTDPILERPQKSLQTWLFNPFHFIAGGKALAIGLGAIVVAALVGSLSNSHFDGVLDFHTGLDAPVWMFVAEGVIDWLSMSILLYLAGLILVGRRVRAIDIFGTQALARVPTVATALVALLPGFQRVSSGLLLGIKPSPDDLAMFGIVAVIGLIMTVWMVALMYRGFAVSCNAKGAKAIVAFIIALLLAEAASKAAIIAMLI